MATTKAQEIYEEVEKRIAAGTDKADAFKALAEETGPPLRHRPRQLLRPQEKARGW